MTTSQSLTRRLTHARQLVTAARGAAQDAEHAASLAVPGEDHRAAILDGIDRCCGWMAKAFAEFEPVLRELRPGGPAPLTDTPVTRDVVKEGC